MNWLIERGGNAYAYCTDFCINIANVLGLSYYEVNFVMFCLIFPLATAGLFGLWLVQRVRLYMVESRLKKAQS